MVEIKRMDVGLSEQDVKKIEKYVKEGRFDSVDDFLKRAVSLLLYAEDNKDLFTQKLGN